MNAPFIAPHILKSAAEALLDEAMPRRDDRILGRRTCGEIVASMERVIASPEYAAEREAFYRARDERDASERARQEAIWAREGDLG